MSPSAPGAQRGWAPHGTRIAVSAEPSAVALDCAEGERGGSVIQVTVKLQAGARAGTGAPAAPLDLSLPDTATAGELLGELADRFAEPLRSALIPTGDGLPTRLCIFIDGQMAERHDQPIASAGRSQARVVVVLASPVSGGA